MFTKGIEYYVFLDSDEYGVTFYAPGLAPVSYRSSSPMSRGNFQIFEGKFAWEIDSAGQVLFGRFAEINAFLGNLLSSDLNDMLSTRSIVTPDYALTYGFYESGIRGFANHLTNQDQSYVYLTSNYSEWMKDLAIENPKFLDSPLNVLALPGAHDAGMFETFNFKLLLGNEDFLNKLSSSLFVPLESESEGISSFDIAGYVERIVINLACTQKDDICTMLNLGIRYFDFRPGYCFLPLRAVPELGNNIFHQHGFIPGHKFYDFLCDIFKWLAMHPEEIVILNLNFQGFEEVSMKPGIDDIMKQVQSAQLNTNTLNIAIGDKADLSVPIRLLLGENKRLIFLNQINSAADAQKYDSYTESFYATTDVNRILAALDRMQSDPPNSETYIVLQLQGTSTADPVVCSTSISDAISPGSSDAMSPLMSTKAIFDNSTYPWIANKVPGKFSPNYLLVFLNDFVDNALVKHAIDITCKRIELWANTQFHKIKVSIPL
jgi:hypothetical protein